MSEANAGIALVFAGIAGFIMVLLLERWFA